MPHEDGIPEIRPGWGRAFRFTLPDGPSCHLDLCVKGRNPARTRAILFYFFLSFPMNHPQQILLQGRQREGVRTFGKLSGYVSGYALHAQRNGEVEEEGREGSMRENFQWLFVPWSSTYISLVLYPELGIDLRAFIPWLLAPFSVCLTDHIER